MGAWEKERRAAAQRSWVPGESRTTNGSTGLRVTVEGDVVVPVLQGLAIGAAAALGVGMLVLLLAEARGWALAAPQRAAGSSTLRQA